MRLPDVAAELHKLAEDFSIPRLHELANEIKRRPSTRSPNHSDPITDELREQIRQTALLSPELSQFQIAEMYNVNQGRVSEILKGKRQ